jgi:hypothetical protein
VWSVICRFGSGVEFEVCQHCGDPAFAWRFVYELPWLSVTPVIGMTSDSLMISAVRFPFVGSWMTTSESLSHVHAV